MNREVVQQQSQQRYDRQQRLDELCARLERLDPDLVEWTQGPHTAAGRCVHASLLLTDERRPLNQLADRLRAIAAKVELLADGEP